MLSYVQYVSYSSMSTHCQKSKGKGEKLREECELAVCDSGRRSGTWIWHVGTLRSALVLYPWITLPTYLLGDIVIKYSLVINCYCV